VPIHVSQPIRVLEQQQFGHVAYEVMELAFRIHNRFGRFLPESVYQAELQRLLGGRACTEVRIDVRHADFCKTYFLDLLVDGGGLFELKTVERLANRHHAQLVNYLLLTGIEHAKLINLRPEKVKHEFVNATLTCEDRTCFEVDDARWNLSAAEGREVPQIVVDLLRDWGTGLDVRLYEQALTHFLGGSERGLRRIEILSDGQKIGKQTVRLASPDALFKITALSGNLETFRSHALRFLTHTALSHVLWINVQRHKVNFEVLSKNMAEQHEGEQ